MPKKKYIIRYFVLLAVFIFAIFIYGATLMNMQLARAEEFKRVIQTTYTEKFVVPAVRGEVFDRNGAPLITNRNIYDIKIDGTKMPNKDYVKIIIDLVDKIKYYNGVIEPDTMPVMAIETENANMGETHYTYTMVLSGSNERVRLDKFLTKNGLSVNTSADELVEFLTSKYKLDEYMPPEERDPGLFRTVLGICYDFDRFNVLLGDNKYTISKDISKVLMAVIMENSHNYPGVEVRLTYERVYNFPTTAPHILGRVGKIPAENLDWYVEQGYSLDARVGTSGVESAFEKYLRGIDGEIERTYDQDGNLIDEKYIKEPVAGKNVYLTIDIKLQQVAEHSVVKTIDRIHALSQKEKEPELFGAEANAGTSVVINPNNGEILALATYPSYDITTAYETEVYNELRIRKDNPFLNRATMGLYEPGSVYKIAVSVAALCNGNITPYTSIYDKGKFPKYETYQPGCWLYNMNGRSHGNINVSEALEHSCNYFYYSVGDMLEVDKLNEYSKHLGFGVRTGIEIGETPGSLASEYMEARGIPWHGGDLLQASIGQSANQFTPLQMATVLGTVLNGGDRYSSHLLLCVKEYGSDEIYYAPEPEILDSIDIPEEDVNAVKYGMRNVISEVGGSANSLFKGFPIVVGGKTGTAQITSEVCNGTFVAFAPYDNPQISMSVVIEKGSKGTWAGFVAEDVMSYYFGYKTYEESMDIPVQETIETTTE